MTAATRFWTPYRQGVLVALLGGAIALGAVVSLFAMFLYRTEFWLWAFLGLLGIGSVTGILWDRSYVEKGGIASCPSCGKSALLLYGWKTARGSTTTAKLWWPERECSECLHDLTEAQP